ncbi:hypothetical protein LTR08_006776 [Meristemomyces frigidus]|nr:hypothetical protein LTR08_006776 [Meristemomyces frigidus]
MATVTLGGGGRSIHSEAIRAVLEYVDSHPKNGGTPEAQDECLGKIVEEIKYIPRNGKGTPVAYDMGALKGRMSDFIYAHAACKPKKQTWKNTLDALFLKGSGMLKAKSLTDYGHTQQRTLAEQSEFQGGVRNPDGEAGMNTLAQPTGGKRSRLVSNEEDANDAYPGVDELLEESGERQHHGDSREQKKQKIVHSGLGLEQIAGVDTAQESLASITPMLTLSNNGGRPLVAKPPSARDRRSLSPADPVPDKRPSVSLGGVEPSKDAMDEHRKPSRASICKIAEPVNPSNELSDTNLIGDSGNASPDQGVTNNSGSTVLDPESCSGVRDRDDANQPDPLYAMRLEVSDSEIQDTMRALFVSLGEVVQGLLDAKVAGKDDPAAFELEPDRHLLALYSRVLGPTSWMKRVLQLQHNSSTTLNAREIVQALLGAGVLMHVLRPEVPWDIRQRVKDALGPDIQYLQEAINSKGHRLKEVLNLAGRKQIGSAVFQTSHVGRHASELAAKLVLSLDGHLRRLSTTPTLRPLERDATDWLTDFEKVVKNSLLLKGRLDTAGDSVYEFTWFEAGSVFDRESMTTLNFDESAERIAVTVFPGVRLCDQARARVIAKAMVVSRRSGMML